MQVPRRACPSWIEDQEEELGCLSSGMCSKGGAICAFWVCYQGSMAVQIVVE